jgi:hypothetical protein
MRRAARRENALVPLTVLLLTGFYGKSLPRLTRPA